VVLGGIGLGVTDGWASEGFALVELARSLEGGRGMKAWLEAPGAIIAGVLPESEVEKINRTLMEGQDASALAALVRAYNGLEVDKSELRRNVVPTLFIVGERDPERPTLDGIDELMSNVSTIVVNDADHLEAWKSEAFLLSAVGFMVDAENGKYSPNGHHRR
jgi:pimeloyl-ACP methyl ester carboxylesterase